MSHSQILILTSLLSLLVSAAVYPLVLRYARRHHIVDNPNDRKLHRRPIPVMGGVAVYAGMMVGSLLMSLLISGASIKWSLMALTSMLVLGFWDDLKNLSASLRFVIQFCIVGAYMLMTGIYFSNFYGFCGIHEISIWIGIPLSLVAGVGIINAVNMIDGVDGYSSGFSMVACISFAVIFISIGQNVLSCLALIVASSILPFFIHNVFGRRSKMFIGDGGTMMLGFLLAIFVLYVNSSNAGHRVSAMGLSSIAISLAIMCIPVFDTLRVMVARIVRGHSPFRPDKSHLHHLFIDMGFSHAATSMIIIGTNVLVILCCLALWRLGASVTVQVFSVIALGILVTFVFYKFMRIQQHSAGQDEEGNPIGTKMWQAFCRAGQKTRAAQRGPTWKTVKAIVDKSAYCGRDNEGEFFEVMKILRAALFGGEKTSGYSEEESLRILKEASRQAVLSIVFDEVGGGIQDIQNSLFVKYVLAYQTIQKRNAALDAEMKSLAALLMSHGVSLEIVKGQVVGRNYPKPWLRSGGDIDFYCDPANYAKAQQVIREEWGGEYESYSPEHHHEQFRHNNVWIEQHKCLVRLNNRRQDALWEQLCRKYYTEIDFDGVTIPTLHPTLHAVYLFLHLYHHLVEKGIGLRQFCDLAMLLHVKRDEINYDELRSHLKAFGVERAYRACGGVLTGYLGLPENELGYTPDRKDRYFMRRILWEVAYRGNMGYYEGDTFRREPGNLRRVKSVFIKLSHFVKFFPLSPGYCLRWIFSKI